MRPINPMWPWRTQEACGEGEKGVLGGFSPWGNAFEEQRRPHGNGGK